MGTLLGHIVSDGSIYIDVQRNHLRTKYTNSDSELIDRFLDAAQRVFGNVHYTSEPARGSVTVRFGSELVGVVLAAAGAMVGNKTKQNGDLPWLVRGGSEAIKIAYLRAAFSDEGSVGASNGFPYLILTRYYTVPTANWVPLGQFDGLMRSSIFPTGHLRRCMSLRRVITCAKASDGFPFELFSLLNTPPRLLTQEAELLAGLGITSKIYPATLSKNHSGSYSLSFMLAVQGKENVRNFYKKVGFSLHRKQEKLRIFLEKIGCI